MQIPHPYIKDCSIILFPEYLFQNIIFFLTKYCLGAEGAAKAKVLLAFHQKI